MKYPRFRRRTKTAAGMDPSTLFAHALTGALGGAIAGSRRSLDGHTLQGVAQGAAMGAVGGVLGGQITGGKGGALAVGTGAGFLGSRGPRGPKDKKKPAEKKPEAQPGQLSPQMPPMARGTGQPLPSPNGAAGEKIAGVIREAFKPDGTGRRDILGQPYTKGIFRAMRERKAAQAKLTPAPSVKVAAKIADKTPKQKLVERCGCAAEGVGLKKDANGWYVATHRSRSKSYPTVDAIPPSVVDDIEKTALSSETIASAAKKRGVTSAYLKRLVQSSSAARDFNLKNRDIGARTSSSLIDIAKAHAAGKNFFPEHPDMGASYLRARGHAAWRKHIKKNLKTASHAAELAGLGILAAPTIAEMRGKKVSDKTKHRAELAGLGVLAAPSAYHVARSGVTKAKGLLARVAKRQ